MRTLILTAAVLLGVGAAPAYAQDAGGQEGGSQRSPTLFTAFPGAEPSSEQTVAGSVVAMIPVRPPTVQPATAPIVSTTPREQRPLTWDDVPAQGCVSLDACLNWGK